MPELEAASIVEYAITCCTKGSIASVEIVKTAPQLAAQPVVPRRSSNRRDLQRPLLASS